MMTPTDDSDIVGSVECIVRSSNDETQGQRERFEGCGGLGDGSDPHVTSASKGNLEAEKRGITIMKDSSTRLKTNIVKDYLKREMTKKDLLSRFKTYDDQLPSSNTAFHNFPVMTTNQPNAPLRAVPNTMEIIQSRLAALDTELPPPGAPKANYVSESRAASRCQ